MRAAGVVRYLEQQGVDPSIMQAVGFGEHRPLGDNATVRFRQHYKSASLKTSSNKVLLMGKRDGRWQILQERVGT
jgi:chemotaxis protein MotB